MRNADRWDALEVRHVRAFAAVVDAGSFAGAARGLGYTQSAVSQQIFALERIVGAPVLLRHPGGRRPVELTDAGRLLLAHAQPLLARVQAAQADVTALSNGEVGHVALATFQSFGARVLPDVLARFRALRPGVDVAIREAPTVDELVDGVERGEVDVAFAVLPFEEGPFEVRDLLRDPYVLVTRAGGEERGLADVDGKRLLGIRRCVHEHFVEARLLAEGIAPASVARFDDNGMIQALARAGEGVAIVPRLTVDPDDAGVEIHLLPELAARQIVAVWHSERHLSAAARELVDVAADVCAASVRVRSRRSA